MKNFYELIYNNLKLGINVVICSIIESSGSTPRGVGAKMAVFDGGSTVGTIGGGSVEYQSIIQSNKLLETKSNLIKDFYLSQNQVADIGMICGGNVTVLFLFVDANEENIKLFESINTTFQNAVASKLVTEIYSDLTCKMYLDYSENEQSSSKPMYKPGDVSVFIEPLITAQTVYVFGGGHVSQELVPVIAHVGFRVVVFENRAEFANKALFPAAENVILGDFDNIGNKIKITASDYVIIMTRGHQDDYDCLKHALSTNASYIGMIGSHRKIAITKQRILDIGIDEQEFNRLHAPIGIEIGSETPAEIAISIAAELIAHRAKI